MNALLTSSLMRVGNASAALARELGTVSLSGPRARRATMATAAVALAVPMGCAMNLPDVWWAAISAVISTMPTRPASIEKGLLRLLGTAFGASLAYALIGWIAYDHAACVLALFAVSSIAILGMAISPHGYAWMFLGVTFTLVVLVSLNDPAQAFSVAIYRTLEVGVGITCAILVATLLAPEAPATGTTPPEPPGWKDPFGAQWPAVAYALRSGITIAALPVIWNTLHLPGIATMAATVAAVMAVPMLPGDTLDDPARLISKAAYRLLGCFIGGIAGLAVIVLSPTLLAPWLVLLCGGVWLFVWLQDSPTGAGYVGTQAAVVYIVTLVQGEGPPLSILPGIDRFAGIVFGIVTLLLITALLRPITARASSVDARTPP
jgi:uncharacterized membrane protein YccC